MINTQFGFIGSRLRIQRKVVVGHWQEPKVQEKIGLWTRAAAGWNELRHLKVARWGDNMREVAVTEGDKVEAQIKLGFVPCSLARCRSHRLHSLGRSDC